MNVMYNMTMIHNLVLNFEIHVVPFGSNETWFGYLSATLLNNSNVSRLYNGLSYTVAWLGYIQTWVELK